MSSLHFDGVSGLVFDLFVRYEKSVGKPNWRAYRPRIPACRPGGSCGSLLEFQRANRRRLGGSKQESPAGRPAELSSVWSWLGCKLVTWVPAAETRLTLIHEAPPGRQRFWRGHPDGTYGERYAFGRYGVRGISAPSVRVSINGKRGPRVSGPRPLSGRPC